MPNEWPRSALAAVAGALAVACGDEALPYGPPLVLTAAPSAVELLAGDSARISIAVSAARGPVRLLWRSSDARVIAVDSTGRVRALDVGAAIVEIGVEGIAPAMLGIPVTAVAPCVLGVPMGRPELAALTLPVGGTGRPQVVAGACRPRGDSTLVYESSDTTIVAIEPASGLPIGKAEGRATIMVRLRAAPSVRVTVPVTVSRPSCTFGPMLTVQPIRLALAPGDTARLTISGVLAPGTPSGRPDYTIVSSDPAVATVTADGTVRARGVGDAVITVSLTSGWCGPISQTVGVTVRAP